MFISVIIVPFVIVIGYVSLKRHRKNYRKQIKQSYERFVRYPLDFDEVRAQMAKSIR